MIKWLIRMADKLFIPTETWEEKTIKVHQEAFLITLNGLRAKGRNAMTDKEMISQAAKLAATLQTKQAKMKKPDKGCIAAIDAIEDLVEYIEDMDLLEKQQADQDTEKLIGFTDEDYRAIQTKLAEVAEPYGKWDIDRELFFVNLIEKMRKSAADGMTMLANLGRRK